MSVLHGYQAITDSNHIHFTKNMITVILDGTAVEVFQPNMSQVPSIGDELVLNDETYLITGRRFVFERTQRSLKNVEKTILYVERI